MDGCQHCRRRGVLSAGSRNHSVKIMRLMVKVPIPGTTMCLLRSIETCIGLKTDSVYEYVSCLEAGNWRCSWDIKMKWFLAVDLITKNSPLAGVQLVISCGHVASGRRNVLHMFHLRCINRSMRVNAWSRTLCNPLSFWPSCGLPRVRRDPRRYTYCASHSVGEELPSQQLQMTLYAKRMGHS